MMNNLTRTLLNSPAVERAYEEGLTGGGNVLTPRSSTATAGGKRRQRRRTTRSTRGRANRQGTTDRKKLITRRGRPASKPTKTTRKLGRKGGRKSTKATSYASLGITGTGARRIGRARRKRIIAI